MGKPKKVSAGVLLFRRVDGAVEFFLVHPGGPFWAKKDDGAWSIPKGELEAGDDPLATARREFAEETGFEVVGELLPLDPLKQPSGKLVWAWAAEMDCDPSRIRSNTFSMEWPPRSGQQREFPEIDRAAWFSASLAKRKILPGQRGFIEQVEGILGLPKAAETEGKAGGVPTDEQGSLF